MQKTLFGQIQGINVLPFEGEALFYQDFLDDSESEFYFKRLQEEYDYRQIKIKLYDKEVLQPKLTAFAGDPGEGLDYSDEALLVQPWTETLSNLKEKVQDIAGTKFTHALLNLYRDGKDHVSWHRDKVRNWGKQPVIASLSLGAARTFQFRNYEEKHLTRTMELTPGSLLIMRGDTNDKWEHRILKSGKRLGPRLNITFRVLKQ